MKINHSTVDPLEWKHATCVCVWLPFMSWKSILCCWSTQPFSSVDLFEATRLAPSPNCSRHVARHKVVLKLLNVQLLLCKKKFPQKTVLETNVVILQERQGRFFF